MRPLKQRVEAMFAYLDTLEDQLDAEGRERSDSADDRAGLGLPKYRFRGLPPAVGAFSCGAAVHYVFLGADEARKRAGAVALNEQSVPAATVDDPAACAEKGLCFPHLVRQEVSVCGQDLLVTRNHAPYGRNHGVVRAAAHEPQSLCFEPFRLGVAFSVARALGSEDGPSEYEVWVAGEGFNTQWHFHLQFRKQHNPVWSYVNGLGASSVECCVARHPSRPWYAQGSDRDRLIDAVYREVSPHLPISQADAGRRRAPAPSIGLLLSYERAQWRAIIVKSWCPRGERLFGKQPGLHEHLGEVIVESKEVFDGIEQSLEASTIDFEARLRRWCQAH